MSEAPAAAPSPKRRVLIVDDDPDVIETLAEILVRAGYQIETAPSGRGAQDRLRAAPFDAVLSDFRMADLDGIALHRWVEAEIPALARRFILITGDGFSPDTEQLLGRSGLPTLGKPFTPTEIRRAVAALFGP
jgi:CheY-like chemotaxis protein